MEIVLQKQKNKKVFQWKVTIVKNTFTTEFGTIGGKIQTKPTTVTTEKNIGKKNFSSMNDQAILKAVKKARNKLTSDPNYIIISGADVLKKYTGKEVKSTVDGVPKPMLAVNGNTPKEREKLKKNHKIVYVQPKLDGFRGLSKDGKLYSRSRKEFTGKVPHLSEYVAKVQQQLGDVFIDGELYAPGMTFNEIQSILLKKPSTMTAEDIKNAEKIRLNVFDFLDYELTNAERIAKLSKVKFNKFVTLVPSFKIPVSEISMYHDKFVDGSSNYEGIMIRLPQGKYENKRSRNLLKWKVFIDIDVEITGMNPEKDNPKKLGTLQVKCVIRKSEKSFKARPAVTRETMNDMMKNPKKYIGQMGVVKYQGLDENTGAPRFGIFKGLRSIEDMGE
jgi:ATP-dependent DNA ligase